MTPGITVVIPSIPPRKQLLQRAIRSVLDQTLSAQGIVVAIDSEKAGAPRTRQRGLAQVTTEYVAFLDDDDFFKPHHLATLMAVAEQGHDYVFSWFDVQGGTDPLGHFGRTWDINDPTQTTITTLVRTKIAQQVGFVGREVSDTIHGQVWGEDFSFTLGCAALGAIPFHVPDRSWVWAHDSGNTSGRPDRW